MKKKEKKIVNESARIKQNANYQKIKKKNQKRKRIIIDAVNYIERYTAECKKRI